MSIFGLPLILFKAEDVDEELSDIQYLAQKAKAGELDSITNVKLTGAVGVLVTKTAGGGNDMYLTKATASIQKTGGFASGSIEVVLKINSNIKDRWFSSLSENVNIGGAIGNKYTFAIGFKATTGQVILLEVISSSSVINCTGTIQTMELPTGTEP